MSHLREGSSEGAGVGRGQAPEGGRKEEGRWKGAVRSDGGWLEEELYRVGAKVQRTEDGAGGCCV